MSTFAWKYILAASILTMVFAETPLLHGLTCLFADEPASRPRTIAEMVEAAKARNNRTPGPVTDEIEARLIASGAYSQKMKLNVLAEEGPRSISTVTLGYDLEGFGKRGDRVWQVLISTGLNPELFRGNIWVHAGTGQVRFIAGAWESINEPEKTKKP